MHSTNRKNLILLQLGGLSRARLWQCRVELANVWRLLPESLRFDRFYASSTSEKTLTEEVAFGDVVATGASLWDELDQRGYRRIAGDDPALEEVSAAAWGKCPFYACFCDNSTYSRQNAFLGCLLEVLAGPELSANTALICFGANATVTRSADPILNCHHISLPYADAAWMPLCVHYPERLAAGVTTRLISAVDLKATLLGLLFPDEPARPAVSPFAGVDVFKTGRQFAFTAGGQGCAVTDGAYRLIFTANEGMELYCDQADPANSLNLLKFFERDGTGNIGRFVYPAAAVARHFASVFGSDQVDSIAAAFRRLKPELLHFAGRGT